MAKRVSLIGRIFGKVHTRRNLILLYVAFVIIPLIIADFLIISGVYRSEKASQEHLMSNEANAVNYTFFNQIDQAAKLGNAIYSSKYVNRFLEQQYASNLEYFEAYQSFFDDTLLNLVEGQSGLKFIIFQTNKTITNGAQFRRLELANDMGWYRYMQRNQLQKGLYFGEHSSYENNSKRAIYYFQRLNYYDGNSKDVLLIEIDYSKCAELLANLNYENGAFICDDSRVLLSNESYSNRNKDYRSIEELNEFDIDYSEDILVYGLNLTIHIEGSKQSLLDVLKPRWIHIMLIALMNILLPLFVSYLMHSEFQNRLREQDMLVARKNAELLALHSQINPHFLFNALESIRMHSILKQENETSEMVAHLAKLQRQYTEWHDDQVPIVNELEFVESYLQLQKYRFGDRLSFEIDADDYCKKYLIPKLTLVTFVENACVHGIESKTTPGWIFVRISADAENVMMEIEDTGGGMSDEEARELLAKMRAANIEMLKEKNRVGVVNACVRLKMMTDNQVFFDLDTEYGTGTLVQIKMPLKYLKGNL
ncbi:MAG: histidine kinase [Pseudobutyrivibrio sp.]|nr:histidine kinase [Pseudobutyrivibrio sp.]